MNINEINAAAVRRLANRRCRLGIDDPESPYHPSRHAGDGDVATDLFERDCADLIEHAMASPYGVLKPLEWRAVEGLVGNQVQKFEAVAFEAVASIPGGSIWFEVIEWRPGSFKFKIDEMHGAVSSRSEWLSCESMEHGQSICWDRYSSKVATAFTTIGSAE